MDFDFALLLVVLSLVTGIVWLFEHSLIHRARVARAEAAGAIAGSEAERQQRVHEAAREPLIVEYARSFFPVILIVLLFRSFIAEPFKIPSGSMMPTLLVGDFILVNKFTYGLRLPVLNTKIFDINEPHRGDVFVFHYPGFTCMRDGKEVRSGKPCEYPLAPVPKQDYIKRVIGLPGDEITYRDKTLYVNGQQIPQEYTGPFVGSGDEGRCAWPAPRSSANRCWAWSIRILELPQRGGGVEGTFHVPAGHYVRQWGIIAITSEDSRYWGFVPEQNLVGKAFVIWMNWDGGIDFKRIGTLIK